MSDGVGGLGGLQCREHRLDGNATARDELPTTAPDRGGEGTGPDVLVDEDARRAAGLENASGLVDVILADQAGRRALEHREVEFAVVVEVRDRDPLDRPVEVLADEDQVEDADDAAVDEVDEVREGLPVHLAAGKLDHDVVDRPHLVKVVGHALLLEDSDGGSGTPPRSDPRQPSRRVASPVACEYGRGGQGLMSEPWTVSARITTMPSAIMTREKT